jgi:asparagine synthase (glutamine-hydrolysing)
MCGIFGILSENGELSQKIMDMAAASLAHRGPDDSGTTIIQTGVGSGLLGLAHRRLSILDLSPLGHQPMRDARTGNWIVFNGEIYNFRELRAELEAKGECFNSQSDTEVILAAYRLWGEPAFTRLRGMFAFGLWDARDRRLLLVRDGMGIKPLYYFQASQNLIFASEVRTLLKTGLVTRKVDSTGLFAFLNFGSVYEPRTIIEGVQAVPSGHVVSIKNGDIKRREFWSPLSASEIDASGNGGPGRSSEATVGDLPELIQDAVISHLVSDVPVGVFLSGGIDSSSLVAVMTHAGVKPSTFSMVFEEGKFSEAEYSRMVARHFSTDHHEIVISLKDVLASLPTALHAMDQPTIDGINTWFLSEKTGSAGVKVALTGIGADEMFGGYSSFRTVPQMERAAAGLGWVPSAVRKSVVAPFTNVGGKSDRNRKLLSFARDSSRHPYFLSRSLFSTDECRELYAGDCEPDQNWLEEREQACLAACEGLDAINRVSYLESVCYLRNTLLRDSDCMSMAHGLELRVPFLDHALVNACLRIAGQEKLRGDLLKNLLIENLGTTLPREIVNRPKQGFTLPFEQWMRGEMQAVVDRSLCRESSLSAWLVPSAVAEVWNRFLSGKTSWSRPWSLFVLEQWCAQNL